MTASGRHQVLVAGAGYAGLHIAQRLGAWVRRRDDVAVTLVDQHDYHQLVVELPRVATGSREGEDVQVPLDRLFSERVQFVRATVTGFDLANRTLQTDSGAHSYTWLALALGSRPNDFNIPGLAEHVLYPYSAEESEAVWKAVNDSVRAAAAAGDPTEQRRLMTVVIGGGGATGVELAGAFAEELPQLAREYGVPGGLGRVILVEAGHTILAGSSPELIGRAASVLRDLGVDVRTNAMVAGATAEGFTLKGGEIIGGGVFIWAGGVKAPELTQGCGLEIGYNGRIKVDQYLRAIDHPEIFVAGDIASVVNPESGHVLPPLAQIALEEGEAVVRNVEASIVGAQLTPFRFTDKGFVVSVGNRRGVAEIAGLTIGGRLAHMLKDSIEWEYRQSVKHLRGWGAV
jgi:NADH dehydrogenase